MNQKISFGNLTDVGQVRKANEDYYASFDSSLGAIFVVCDGMGGHVGGAIASQTAVLAIKEYYESTQQENTIVSLQEALVLANDAIHKK